MSPYTFLIKIFLKKNLKHTNKCKFSSKLTFYHFAY